MCQFLVILALRLNDNIRRDSDTVDIAPLWRVVIRDGKLNRRAVPERDNRLHNTLAKTLRPYNCCHAVILYRPGKNLRSTRTVAVHNNRHRDINTCRIRLVILPGSIFILHIDGKPFRKQRI